MLAIVSVLLIPERSIDHGAVRGLEEGDDDGEEGGKSEGFRVLLHHTPMLILAASLASFHLGSGAVLSLHGFAVIGAGKCDSAMPTETTVMIAQGVMIVTSLLVLCSTVRAG